MTVKKKQPRLSPLVSGGLVAIMIVVALFGWLNTSAYSGDDDGDDGEVEIYGRIDSFPAGLIGDWVVDGTTYTADVATEFKQEHGPFGVEVCVKIHVKENTAPPLMREIETEHDFRCGDGDTPPDSAEGEMYGIIQSFPDGLIGTWDIGGILIDADENTEFDQEDAPFAVGITVEVHFVVEEGTIYRAREIESHFETDDDDDDGDGDFDGAEGHAYGAVEEFPAGLIGEWRIGGILYTATDLTRFEEEDGEFTIGAQVKVDYLLRDGVRIARKIETTSDNGEVSDGEHFKVFGYVRAMPVGSFMGTWTVDDTGFLANSGSKFEEEHGLLAVGAYVSVEYWLEGEQAIIHEMETHVPPGAGSHDSVGPIEDRTDILSAAATAQTIWTIAGQDYQIIAATSLDDAAASLDVGTVVIVNSYDDGNGNRIATRIRSLVMDTQTFVPWTFQ